MQRPTGVTVLAVLAFVGGGLLVLAALVMFVGGAMVSTMTSYPLGTLGTIGGAIVGVVLLGFAVLYVVLGLGLWKLQNWARILSLVLVGLGLLFNVLGLLGSLLHFHLFLLLWRVIVVAIQVWIVMYLLKPEIKQAFAATGL
jgi:hypothetical protein